MPVYRNFFRLSMMLGHGCNRLDDLMKIAALGQHLLHFRLHLGLHEPLRMRGDIGFDAQILRALHFVGARECRQSGATA